MFSHLGSQVFIPSLICDFSDLVSSSSSRSSSSSCPPLECWFMKEKTGGGFRAQQQKSLLHIRTDENSPTDDSEPTASDVGADRVFFITGNTVCPSVDH